MLFASCPVLLQDWSSHFHFHLLKCQTKKSARVVESVTANMTVIISKRPIEKKYSAKVVTYNSGFFNLSTNSILTTLFVTDIMHLFLIDACFEK